MDSANTKIAPTSRTAAVTMIRAGSPRWRAYAIQSAAPSAPTPLATSRKE